MERIRHNRVKTPGRGWRQGGEEADGPCRLVTPATHYAAAGSDSSQAVKDKPPNWFLRAITSANHRHTGDQLNFLGE